MTRRTVPVPLPNLRLQATAAVPTAPAWLQRVGLGADVIGTGATQRGSEGGGCLMLTTLPQVEYSAACPRRRLRLACRRSLRARYACERQGDADASGCKARE